MPLYHWPIESPFANSFVLHYLALSYFLLFVEVVGSSLAFGRLLDEVVAQLLSESGQRSKGRRVVIQVSDPGCYWAGTASLWCPPSSDPGCYRQILLFSSGSRSGSSDSSCSFCTKIPSQCASVLSFIGSMIFLEFHRLHQFCVSCHRQLRA